jgi:hypothetical protein
MGSKKNPQVSTSGTGNAVDSAPEQADGETEPPANTVTGQAASEVIPGIPPDPFQPKMRIASTEQVNKEIAEVISKPGRAPIAPLPAQAMSLLPSLRMGATASLPPARVEAAPQQAVSSQPVLKGIIQGRPNVAVLGLDGKTYIAKIGDRVGESYQVRSIKNNMVVLARLRLAAGQNQVTLSVEGE